jgi:hypothetical protein
MLPRVPVAEPVRSEGATVDLTTFYATVGGISFTLHGLWWVVVMSKREWQQQRPRRLMAYVVSMHFLLPGMMSLLSIIAPDEPLLWRTTFALAGLLGVVGVLLVLRTLREEHDTPSLVRLIQVLVLPVYGLITVLALFPELPATLGLGLRAIQVEAIITTVLLFFGVQSAWVLMLEPRAPGLGDGDATAPAEQRDSGG